MIVNIHATRGKDLKEGDVGLVIVKVMVVGGRGLDGKGSLRFKLYKCPHHRTPGFELESTIHEPQGDKVYGTAEELTAMCLKLYPAVVQAGILPDPDTII